jgi:hypothetical protein
MITVTGRLCKPAADVMLSLGPPGGGARGLARGLSEPFRLSRALSGAAGHQEGDGRSAPVI